MYCGYCQKEFVYYKTTINGRICENCYRLHEEGMYGKVEEEILLNKTGFDKYSDYLLSEHWINTRDKNLLPFCERCKKQKDLHVYHVHFYSLGEEKPEDLITLCTKCKFKTIKPHERGKYFTRYLIEKKSPEKRTWGNFYLKHFSEDK